MTPPQVIAEIGCNHKGDPAIAKEMIHVAAYFCKVDVVKFQKRNPRELLSAEQYAAPHPNPANSYGRTYGEHREFLEFNLDQHRVLKECCDQNNVQYSSSVWDLTSAREIASLNPALIKVPSATNANSKLLAYLCENFGGEIHVSVGMTTRARGGAVGRFHRIQGPGPRPGLVQLHFRLSRRLRGYLSLRDHPASRDLRFTRQIDRLFRAPPGHRRRCRRHDPRRRMGGTAFHAGPNLEKAPTTPPASNPTGCVA
jgi:hypothetical protein